MKRCYFIVLSCNQKNLKYVFFTVENLKHTSLMTQQVVPACNHHGCVSPYLFKLKRDLLVITLSDRSETVLCHCKGKCL